MSKYIKRSIAWAVSAILFIFVLVSEDMFKHRIIFPMLSNEKSVIINRAIIVVVLLASLLLNALYYWIKRGISIKGKNYSIKVSYGNIFKQKDCKIVIPFDECFTSTVGSVISDINPKSICGQYLIANNSLNIQQLLDASALKAKEKSKFENRDRYESGKVILQDKFLLLAFIKLDMVRKGVLTREEYIDSLSILWKEIGNYYG